MKKILAIIVAVILVIAVIALVIGVSSNKDSRVTNDSAERDTNGRYLTIINDTDQVINEVHVTVGDGTEIEEMRQTNPDEKSFSIEIPEEYSEYNTFTITLVDRYDLNYQKQVTDVKSSGRTEVKITEDDYIEEKGDFWDKLDKWFNGD